MNAWRNNGQRPRRLFRDYHRQRLGNPLFPRSSRRAAPYRHPTRSRSGAAMPDLRRRAGLALVAAAAAGGLWYAFWSPAFRIKDIQVAGASPATEETVRKALDRHMDRRAMLVVPRSNILVFDDAAAKEDIERYVFLSGIDIRKKLPGSLMVDVREKAARAVFASTGRLFAVDETGIIIRELTEKEIAQVGELPPGMGSVPVQGLGAETLELEAETPADAASGAERKNEPEDEKRGERTLPLVLDRVQTNDTPVERLPGRQAFTPSTLSLILQANARLPDVTGEDIRWFTVDAANDTLEAQMAPGWRVFMSTANAFDIQAERLGLVLKERIKDRKDAIDYIDLRYNERIFYRLKDAP